MSAILHIHIPYTRNTAQKSTAQVMNNITLIRWILVPILLTIILPAQGLTFSQVIECIANATFSSTRTPFKSNLDSLFSSLSVNIDTNTGNLFYNASTGVSPDTAYASVLCGADAQTVECRKCVKESALELLRSCPNAKQAIIWDDFCTLRYSNESMFRILAMNPGWSRYSEANVSSPLQFKVDLRKLLDRLRVQAPLGTGALRRVAWGNRSTDDFQTIFALVQCAPDVSADDCSNCLSTGIADVPEFCDGKMRCRVLKPSCIVRFSTEPDFYNASRLLELSIPAARSAVPPSTVPVKSTPPPPQLPPQLPPAALTEAQPTAKSGGRNSRTIIVSVVVSVAAAFLAAVCLVGIICIKRGKQRANEAVEIGSKSLGPWDQSVDIRMSTFESLQYDFEEIKAATDGFSDANKLGKGGFGAVYWGKLANGQEIAVKRLSMDSGQGNLEFKNEVLLVARLQHRNLVKLLGFSIHGKEKLLIYEFVENAGLNRFIFDRIKRAQVSWDTRYNIIMGIAKGLVYLHEDSRFRIVHRDLKPSNIVLDKEMNPKITDFGIARLFAPDVTHDSTLRIIGTQGYMSPEYAMLGQFSSKSDVYSFGVLILEIISGQQNSTTRDGTTINLLTSAWKHWHQGTAANVIDPVLINVGLGISSDMLRCIHIGLLCVQDNPSVRPTMTSVYQMLINSCSASHVLSAPSEPGYAVAGSLGSNVSTVLEKHSVPSSFPRKNDESLGDLYPRPPFEKNVS